MEVQIGSLFAEYSKARASTEKVVQKDILRRSLLTNAQLLKSILIQQLNIDQVVSKENHNNSSIKQDLTKSQHEKRLLDNKVSLLTTEIETWKKKSANQTALQKEILSLKSQLTKLNTQLNESRNESSKAKQQFITQKAVLESKLENAKKNIKNLKDSKTTTALNSKQIAPPSLISPVKLNKSKPSNDIILKKPLVSNFSVSPFLHKAIKSPTKQDSNSLLTPSTKNVLAQSTPGTLHLSPLKRLAAKKKRGPSGLKNLISPEKSSSDQTKKNSLFDDEEDDDNDDLFGSSVRKVAQKAQDSENIINNQTEQTTTNLIKRKKRRLGGKTIIEEADVEDEINYNKFSPLKRVKLMDTLGGISPLKQRNKERNLFKV